MVSQKVLDSIVSESPTLIYSAPRIETPSLAAYSGNSADELRAALGEEVSDGMRFAIHFQLANNALRRHSSYPTLGDAVHHYQLALKLQEDHAKLRANLGAALFLSLKHDEAELHLRRALMLSPDLVNPIFYLALLDLARNHLEEAKDRLNQFRLKHIESGSGEHLASLFALSAIAIEQNDAPGRRKVLEQILTASPDHRSSQAEFVRLELVSGQTLFDAGDFEAAMATWAKTYAAYPRPFSSDQEIAAKLRALVTQSNEKELFQKELAAFREKFQSEPDNPKPHYRLTLSYLFVHGLLPEFFEAFESLQHERARWLESLLNRGEHPYPHYRLALIAFYSGDLDNAYRELSIARDRFPPKKQVALKIKELFSFLDIARKIHDRSDEFRNINLPDYEWEQAGFRDPFTLRAWRETGLSPTDAAIWMAEKFSPVRAGAWKQAGIAPDVARRWTDSGFSDPVDVRAWIRGDFQPEEAKLWRDAHLARNSEPLPMQLLIQYRRAGFTDAELVYRWSEVLQVPFEAATWSELGFSPEEAAEWRDLGFTDAYDAAHRKQQHQTAKEALRNFRE